MCDSSIAVGLTMATGRRAHTTDSGWAWVVLVASLGNHFLNGAECYCVGLVHVGLLQKFQPDTITFLALSGAVFSSLICIAAPLASYVIDRFGCRVCCVIGGLITFTGYTSSAFATSITQIFFTYGIIAGLGIGFVYTSTNVTIGFYFDRLRGVASGISNSFQGVGILVGSVTFQALLEEYTVSGALLLLGAVSLHFCFFGMFFRPTMFERRQAKTVIVVPEQGPQTESDSSKPFLGEICTSSLPLFEDGRLEERGSDDVECRMLLTGEVERDKSAKNRKMSDVTCDEALPDYQATSGAQTAADARVSTASSTTSAHTPNTEGACRKPERGDFESSVALLTAVGEQQQPIGIRGGPCDVISDVTSRQLSAVSCEASTRAMCADGESVSDSVGGSTAAAPHWESSLLNKCLQSARDTAVLISNQQTDLNPLLVDDQLKLDSGRNPGDSEAHEHEDCGHSWTSDSSENNGLDNDTTSDHITASDEHPSDAIGPKSPRDTTPTGEYLHQGHNDITYYAIKHTRPENPHDEKSSVESCLKNSSDTLTVKEPALRSGHSEGDHTHLDTDGQIDYEASSCDRYGSLLMNKAFMLHSLSLFASNIHVSGVFLHLPEYTQLRGTTSSQSASLFLAVGTTSIVSKLCCGLATSDPRIDPLVLSVGLMGLSGIVTCLFPLYSDSYTNQMAFSALFGLFVGGLYALINPLLIRYVNVRLLAHAYGISVFFMGIGYLSGPVVAAMIVDGGGTYGHSFLLLGLMMLCGAILDLTSAAFLTPPTSRNVVMN